MNVAYDKYIEFVYKWSSIIGMYVALSIAAMLTWHDAEFEIRVKEIGRPRKENR